MLACFAESHIAGFGENCGKLNKKEKKLCSHFFLRKILILRFEWKNGRWIWFLCVNLFVNVVNNIWSGKRDVIYANERCRRFFVLEKWAPRGCSRILGERDVFFLVARHLRKKTFAQRESCATNYLLFYANFHFAQMSCCANVPSANVL